MNVHFQGSGKSTFFIDGTTVQMFSGGDGWGNVLKEMANGNRWILGVNEDPNAEFPRLTYGKKVRIHRIGFMGLVRWKKKVMKSFGPKRRLNYGTY